MTQNAPKYIKMLEERVERLEAENAALRAKEGSRDRLVMCGQEAVDALGLDNNNNSPNDVKDSIERLRAKLNPPWLEKPDDPGLWWLKKGNATPCLCHVYRFDGNFRFWDGSSVEVVSDHPGRWSRAILPENPQ